MAAELLWEGAKNTVALLLKAAQCITGAPGMLCLWLYSYQRSWTYHDADVKSFNRAIVLHKIWAFVLYKKKVQNKTYSPLYIYIHMSHIYI